MTAIEHVMDTATVRIGRDVVGYKAREQGRRLKHAQSMKIQKEKNEPIEVYSGSTYVAEMPLCLLTRFSKLAAGALPRSKNGSNISATATVDKDTETSGKRKLILHHWSGVEPPTDASVLICLDYMRDNKSVGREQILQAFHIPAEASILTLLNGSAPISAHSREHSLQPCHCKQAHGGGVGVLLPTLARREVAHCHSGIYCREADQ